MRCNLCDKNTLEHGKMKFYPDPISKTGVICSECKDEISEVRYEWTIIDEEKEMNDLRKLFE